MAMTWSGETPVQRNPRAVWRAFEREVAIIAPWEGAIRTLNEVGARCWELADGRSFAEIVDILVNEYGISRTALEADLRAFLDDLSRRDLLVMVEARK